MTGRIVSAEEARGRKLFETMEAEIGRLRTALEAETRRADEAERDRDNFKAAAMADCACTEVSR